MTRTGPQINLSLDDARAARRTVLLIIGLTAVGLAWRIVLACLMPALSRDGVHFCWLARDLGERGLALLRDESTQQHPLFFALILAVQRIAASLGAADSPLTWQTCGQIVALTSGVAVIPMTAAVAWRLVGELRLPVDGGMVAAFAAAFAAILPLNNLLSADVMSDQLCLVLYLGGVFFLLRMEGVRSGLSCGLLSGLAFLTRPEGAIVALAGFVVLLRKSDGALRNRAVTATAMLVGFLISAVPFWVAAGKLLPKKNPVDALAAQSTASESNVGDASLWIEFATKRPPEQRRFHAVLIKSDAPWYFVGPLALYHLMRAGRVIVPLLAILPILNLRRRMTQPPLLGPAACAVGHFLLISLLLWRWKYLQPRHGLTIIALLIPFAAMFAARITSLSWRKGRRGTAAAIVAGIALPLAVYALRIPNGDDRFLRRGGEWLVEQDADIRSKLLLSGSSPRRVAFYAGMRFQAWPEHERAYESLKGHILANRPDYLAIETADDKERTGNEQLIEKLMKDPEIHPPPRLVHQEEGVRRKGRAPAVLHIFAFVDD